MMLNVHTSLDLDVAAVVRHLERHGDAAAEAMAEHLGEVADSTTPEDGGALIRSRRVTQDGSGHYVVSYDTPYAVRQHEELDYQHDPGRRAKWLEQAMAEESDALLGIGRDEMAL